MSITNQNEYKLSNGQIISIQFSVEGNCWEVACSNADDSVHWYKEFDNEQLAKDEFEKWRK